MLQNEIPQGSCLSPLLLSITINHLPEYINGPLALYANDCSFWQIATDINEINQKMQNNLFNVQTWCYKWGFKIFVPISCHAVYSKKKTTNIALKIKEENTLFKNKFNYLGVYFQTNGTYNKHTKYMSDRCSKRMNILRYVKGTNWGVSKEPMLALYSALIRSVV